MSSLPNNSSRCVARFAYRHSAGADATRGYAAAGQRGRRQGNHIMMAAGERKFVGRAGEKLDAALDAFALDVAGAVCADFGCNVGGFTDCLLARGAAKVYAVDTGYGALAWSIRRDPRVVVMERTNALYVDPPEPADLVAIDVGWTVQEVVVPAAMRWVKAPSGRIVSLLKPHYELAKLHPPKPSAAISEDQARAACLEVCGRLARAGLAPAAVMPSVIKGKGGNVEFLLLFHAGPGGVVGPACGGCCCDESPWRLLTGGSRETKIARHARDASPRWGGA